MFCGLTQARNRFIEGLGEMGTNYYLLYTNMDNPANHVATRRHIGKSNVGWTFALRVYPSAGILDLPNWRLLFNIPGSVITNEYGTQISLSEMINIITKRRSVSVKVPHGYADWNDFHAKNFSMWGPNGLIRNCLSRDVIGHGEGPWDLIKKEFS